MFSATIRKRFGPTLAQNLLDLSATKQTGWIEEYTDQFLCNLNKVDSLDPDQ
jgi:hypothetical protein